MINIIVNKRKINMINIVVNERKINMINIMVNEKKMKKDKAMQASGLSKKYLNHFDRSDQVRQT